MSAIPYHSLNKETKKQLVDRTVAIVGDKWSLHVLGNLAFEESPLRFNQLMEKLDRLVQEHCLLNLQSLLRMELLGKR